MDKKKYYSQRVEDLLAQMTLEEKLGQMMQLAAIEEGATEFIERYHLGSYLHAIGEDVDALKKANENSRLKIPLLFAIDAIHGHCFEDGATLFPVQLALACTWNSDICRKIGQITAREAHASGISWTFSPVLCVGRDPRWGRTSETFGEDPLLITEMASAMADGYQSAAVPFAACAKHYAAYGETDGGRDAADAHVSERQLRTVFLPPFQTLAQQGCATFMVGYQSLNGIPCSANVWLLNQVLRQEWGYEGVVVTDWNNVGQMLTFQGAAADMKTAVELCLAASNDIFMSTPAFFNCALELIAEGKVTVSRINESVRRVLSLKEKLGLFDDNQEREARAKVLDDASRWETALKAARESIVLLKNSNQFLPLTHQHKRILLVGDNAEDLLAHVGDWSFIPGLQAFEDTVTHRSTVVTLKQALENACQERQISLDFVSGCSPIQTNGLSLPISDTQYDVIIFCAGDTLPQYGEFHDRANLCLTGNQLAVFNQLVQTGIPIVSVLLMSKPLIIGEVAEKSEGVLVSFNPGAKGGPALVSALFGEFNPCGKLPISFPRSEGQLPVYYNQAPGWHSVLSAHYSSQEAYIDTPATPLFAFGEGFSYSALEWGSCKVSADILTVAAPVILELVIHNTSELAAVEIVQLYVRQVIPGVTSPKKRLLKFKRVNIKPRSRTIVSIEVQYRDLEALDMGLQPVVPLGETLLMVGSSSRDQDLETITIKVEE